MRRAAAIAFALAFVLSAAVACGEDEADTPTFSEPTPRSEAGVLDPGPLDEIDGRRWGRLSEERRTELAADYVDANPDRCKGADPGVVADYVVSAYVVDFPIKFPVSDVIPEGCDAALP